MRFASGVLLAFGMTGLPALASPPQDAKIVDQVLRKFNDDFYRLNADENDKIAAIREIAQYRHPRVVKALAPVMAKAPILVRVATARELSRFEKVEGVSQALVGALRSPENARLKTSAVRIEVLRSLGTLKARDAAPEVDKMVDNRDVWIAKAAIDATGRIRAKGSIEVLIRALRRIEGPEGNNEVNLNLLGDEIPALNDREIIRREVVQKAKPVSEREVLRDPLVQALQAITRHDAAIARDWEAWWKKNERSFKVPE
jgi:hypothetical protein